MSFTSASFSRQTAPPARVRRRAHLFAQLRRAAALGARTRGAGRNGTQINQPISKIIARGRRGRIGVVEGRLCR